MFLTRAAVIFVLLTSLLLNLACGKIYQRCELARELRNFDVPENEISTWVCIAKYESLFDTAAMNHGSGDHGLFQISELYWCSPPGQGYGCNSPCSKFRDDDISDDLQCIRRIHNEHKRISGDGFNAWVVYPLYCKGDTSSYISDCFDEESSVGSLPSVNVTENEISTSEETDGEYGDGYQFPSLPNFSIKEKVSDDGYEFPELPKIEKKSSKNGGRLLPFNKVSINNFVSVENKLPYSKVSISHFIPVKSVYNDHIPVDQFPYSKTSIHHFVPAQEKEITTEEALSKNDVAITDFQKTSTTPKSFNPLQPLTFEKSTTQAEAHYQEENINPTKFVHQNIDLQTPTSVSLMTLPTFKPFQPIAFGRGTTKAPLSTTKQISTAAPTSTSNPTFKPLLSLNDTAKMTHSTTSYQTTLTTTVKPLPTFKPLLFVSSSHKTTKIPFQRSYLSQGTTTMHYETTLTTTAKPLPTFKPLHSFSATDKTTMTPLNFNGSGYHKSTSTTTMKPLPTFRTLQHLTSDSPTKKTPLISQRSGFEDATSTPLIQSLSLLRQLGFNNVETTVSPNSFAKQFSTIRPSAAARQVTFAPDSWFSWIFNTQTLPPILPPRPPSGNPDRPNRPGGSPSGPLERPPGPPPPPRPMRPSDPGSAQRPQGPLNRPEMGGFTTRRPLPGRPSNQGLNQNGELPSGSFTTRRPFPLRPGSQPSRIQAGLQQPGVRPHRPNRPFLNRGKKEDESSVTEKTKEFEAKEVMLDNHSVVVRTRYGFRLFHTK